MPETTDLLARLTEVSRVAVALEKQTQCPAPLMIAQWAVESRWGAKPVGHANYFGMKKNARDPKCCTTETEEVVNSKRVEEESEFADYDSLEDSCRDYAVLITTGEPYRAAWERYSKDHDLNALIVAVAAKYASDPNYGHLVMLIANQANVVSAVKQAIDAVKGA